MSVRVSESTVEVSVLVRLEQIGRTLARATSIAPARGAEPSPDLVIGAVPHPVAEPR